MLPQDKSVYLVNIEICTTTESTPLYIISVHNNRCHFLGLSGEFIICSKGLCVIRRLLGVRGTKLISVKHNL